MGFPVLPGKERRLLLGMLRYVRIFWDLEKNSPQSVLSQAKSDGKFLAWLFCLERLLKVQAEVKG